MRASCPHAGALELEVLRITELVWLEDVVIKLVSKHRVDPDEVAELFLGHPKFRFVEAGHSEGEDVYAALGRTEAGRYLITFFLMKRGGRALPISAREMTDGERKLYDRK
jgi:uncharacterized DUF497 family protein